MGYPQRESLSLSVAAFGKEGFHITKGSMERDMWQKTMGGLLKLRVASDWQPARK